MKEVHISNNATVYENLSELQGNDKSLMDSAIKAVENAYAPYSKFNVGAAILLEDGSIVTGNNQENAAYPSGMCAERVAIWKVASSFPDKKIQKIAIAVKSLSKKVDKPVGPCGACRQTILEYEQKQNDPIEVLFMGEVGQIVKTKSIVSLLPFSFDSSYL